MPIPPSPATSPRSPTLEATECPDGWFVDHVDPTGNRWSACDCAHPHADEALACARRHLDTIGRRAFVTFAAAVGGVTREGAPMPAWEALCERERDGWRLSALAVEKGQAMP